MKSLVRIWPWVGLGSTHRWSSDSRLRCTFFCHETELLQQTTLSQVTGDSSQSGMIGKWRICDLAEAGVGDIVAEWTQLATIGVGWDQLGKVRWRWWTAPGWASWRAARDVAGLVGDKTVWEMETSSPGITGLGKDGELHLSEYQNLQKTLRWRNIVVHTRYQNGDDTLRLRWWQCIWCHGVSPSVTQVSHNQTNRVFF